MDISNETEIKMLRPDGLEEKPKPLMVMPVTTQQIERPDGSVLEVTFFQVIDPVDKTSMATEDFEGKVTTVMLASVPVMVKPPTPRSKIIRGPSMPRGPRGRA